MTRKKVSSNFILPKSLSLKMVEEKLSFNLSNFVHQEFPFTLKLIEFVNENADAEIKQKLDRSCKYFYQELPFCIVDSIEITENKQRIENELFDGCIDFIDDDQLQVFLMNTDNIWLTKKLNLLFQPSTENKFTAKISRCDASEISIFKADVPFHIFEKLTKSGKVECLDLSSSSIVADYDDSKISFEDVLSLVPNARIIRMLDCHITKKTMSKLLKIQWKKKITELTLNDVDGQLDANLFFKFVKRHVDSGAQIHVDFTFENNAFRKLYNKKVIKSGENLPIFGTLDTPVKKKQTWMKRCLQIIRSKFAPTKEVPKLDEEPSAPMKKVVYTNENMERQYTTFPYPHMCYIRENADGETWKKLEQTCKFFHEKNPYNILDDLHVGIDNKFTISYDNKKMVFENVMEYSKKLCKPLWILNSLTYLGRSLVFLTRNEAKKISLGFYLLSMEQFKWLTKYGMVKELDAQITITKSEDGEIISLKELLFYLPNAETIRVQVRGINPVNSSEPIILPQSNKIQLLFIRFYEDAILADIFFDVLTKSLAPKARVELDLTEFRDNEMDLPKFKADLKAKLDTWKPQIERPTVKISF